MYNIGNVIHIISYLNNDSLYHIEQVMSKAHTFNKHTPLSKIIYTKNMLLGHNKQIYMLHEFNPKISNYYQHKMYNCIYHLDTCIQSHT